MNDSIKGTPAIYVACLASYNAGRLFGTWIDLTVMNTEDDVMTAIQEMLAESPVAGAEEWEIHDSEHLPTRHLQSLSAMLYYAEAVESGCEPEVLAHLLDDNISPECIEEEAQDRYQGHFDELAEFAQHHFYECLCVELEGVPSVLVGAIDWAEVAEQLRLKQEFEYIKAERGGYHILGC